VSAISYAGVLSYSSEIGIISTMISSASQFVGKAVVGSPEISEEPIAGDDRDDGNLDKENVGDGK